MVMNIQIKITDAEWEVMRIVWAHGSVTSREIIEILESKYNGRPQQSKR